MAGPFIPNQLHVKLRSFIANLAAAGELIAFAGIPAPVDKACPRADRAPADRAPYPTWVTVGLFIVQAIYSLMRNKTG
jgi:IS5 family transposase